MSLEAMSHWLSSHPDWILWGIVVMAFLESLALVGILVPGVAILFAIAVAAGSAHLDLLPVLIAGFSGAVAGDTLSYFLGRHYHQHIKQLAPFKKHPHWISNGERFFNRYGLISIVIGRFIGPLRPVMPLIAGMMDMKPMPFISVNIVSAIGWAPLYLLPGYYLGSAADSNQLQQQHALLIIGILVASWLIGQVLGWCITRPLSRARKIQLLAALFSVSCCGFILIYSQLDNPWVIALNQNTALFFIELRQPLLDAFFICFTELASITGSMALLAAIALVLLIGRHYYLAAAWVTSTLLGALLVTLLKQLFGIARPQLIFNPPENMAYPSGHSFIVVQILFLLWLSVSPSLNYRWQKPLLSLCSGIAILMIVSRLYLSVHWLTDVGGGLLLALAICSLITLMFMHKPFKAINPKPVLIIALLASCAYLAISVIPQWDRLQPMYQPLTSITG